MEKKTSGKSLVLSLIDYCLGKDKGISLKVQTELATNVDEIFLEIAFGEKYLLYAEESRKTLLYFSLLL